MARHGSTGRVHEVNKKRRVVGQQVVLSECTIYEKHTQKEDRECGLHASWARPAAVWLRVAVAVSLRRRRACST